MKVLQPTPDGLAEAAEALHRGEVVAYPTETVYGLAVNPWSVGALEALFTVKRRERGNPIILLIADPKDLPDVVREVTPAAQRCIDAFWPGPLSLVLPRQPKLPAMVTAGSDLVSVRCPDCPVARAFCRAVGKAITSTSANQSGAAPARAVEELDLPGVAFAIDGGPRREQSPSTVFDPAQNRVLRTGPVSANALSAALAQA